ncbi:MAG: N-acetyltransferase [Deltaproteobacteria bacterium HGW-Deltaproteobacteria-10]|nr:MAG: N-acetyltransferase [Deltaproteobacteria bacterium HGW-Deltaproteobacteria-10]
MNIYRITYREQIRPSDLEAIARIVKSSSFFSPAEIDLACELAAEKLSDGNACSYQFLFGENDDFVWGYTCFGLIPATAGSYDLYWIAVDNHLRAKGLGRQLLKKTEDVIRNAGGQHIYAETSSRDQYRTTQGFYEGCGYTREALLKDFYAAGDSKVIYSKVII